MAEQFELIKHLTLDLEAVLPQGSVDVDLLTRLQVLMEPLTEHSRFPDMEFLLSKCISHLMDVEAIRHNRLPTDNLHHKVNNVLQEVAP